MTLLEEIDRLFQNAQQTIINEARAKQDVLDRLSDAISKYTPVEKGEEMKRQILAYLNQLGLHAANAHVIPLDKLLQQRRWPDIDIKPH